jgi:glycerol-3-phosphate acyltransferase PlsY
MPESWVAVGLAVVAGFFLGSINPATIVATVFHADLRQGSGNPGATNIGRVLGVRWGVVVGVVDVFKGLVPTLLALWLGDRLTAYAVGLATVLGHVLSPFLHGRGGKGVATSMGAVLALFPWFAVVMALVFALVRWGTRSMALSSIVAAGLLGLYAGLAPLPKPVVAGRLWGVCIAVLVIFRHYGNIRRWARHGAV